MSGQWKHGVWAAVIAIVGAGCGDDDKTDKAGEPARATPTAGATLSATPIPASDGPSFAGFDLPGLTERLNGVWIVDKGKAGKRAWEIRGEQITISDGTTDTQGKFTVESPCRLGVPEKIGGMMATSYYSFAFAGDTLYVGDGRAGLRSGDTVVACIFGGTYVYKDGTCTRWDMRGRGWKSEKAECRSSSSGFGVTLKTGGQYSVSGDGPVMMDGGLRNSPAERADDFAAAKARL